MSDNINGDGEDIERFDTRVEQLPEPEELTTNSIIRNRYTLIRLLGRGGMGEVWEALDKNLNEKKVAIKFLTFIGPAEQREEYQKRFKNEGAIMSLLSGAHLVRVTDQGQLDDGQPFIVMDYLNGTSLGDKLEKEGPIAAKEVVEIVRDVAKALIDAHALNIVHRDLKPANVFLEKSPSGTTQIKVLDFGIAKLVDQQSDTQKMTGTGMVIGTAPYMAPEQFEVGKIGPKCDIYALGILAYECLTGDVPFKGDYLAIMRAHVHDERPPPISDNTNAPRQVKNFVLSLLQRQLDLRPTPAEVQQTAEKLLNDPQVFKSQTKQSPVTEPKRIPLLAVIAASIIGLVSLGGAALLFNNAAQKTTPQIDDAVIDSNTNAKNVENPSAIHGSITLNLDPPDTNIKISTEKSLADITNIETKLRSGQEVNLPEGQYQIIGSSSKTSCESKQISFKIKAQQKQIIKLSLPCKQQHPAPQTKTVPKGFISLENSLGEPQLSEVYTAFKNKDLRQCTSILDKVLSENPSDELYAARVIAATSCSDTLNAEEKRQNFCSERSCLSFPMAEEATDKCYGTLKLSLKPKNASLSLSSSSQLIDTTVAAESLKKGQSIRLPQGSYKVSAIHKGCNNKKISINISAGRTKQARISLKCKPITPVPNIISPPIVKSKYQIIIQIDKRRTIKDKLTQINRNCSAKHSAGESFVLFLDFGEIDSNTPTPFMKCVKTAWSRASIQGAPGSFAMFQPK